MKIQMKIQKSLFFLFFYHPQHEPPQYQQIPQRKYWHY